jgi:hypothetical protein
MNDLFPKINLPILGLNELVSKYFCRDLGQALPLEPSSIIASKSFGCLYL